MAYTISEFASAVREKYNAYYDKTDEELARAYVEKYPVYDSQIDWSTAAPVEPAEPARTTGVLGQAAPEPVSEITTAVGRSRNVAEPTKTITDLTPAGIGQVSRLAPGPVPEPWNPPETVVARSRNVAEPTRTFTGITPEEAAANAPLFPGAVPAEPAYPPAEVKPVEPTVMAADEAKNILDSTSYLGGITSGAVVNARQSLASVFETAANMAGASVSGAEEPKNDFAQKIIDQGKAIEERGGPTNSTENQFYTLYQNRKSAAVLQKAGRKAMVAGRKAADLTMDNIGEHDQKTVDAANEWLMQPDAWTDKNKYNTTVKALAIVNANQAINTAANIGSFLPGGNVPALASMYAFENGQMQQSMRKAGIDDPDILNEYGAYYTVPATVVEFGSGKVVAAPVAGILKTPAGKAATKAATGLLVKQTVLKNIAKATGSTIGSALVEGSEELTQNQIQSIVTLAALKKAAEKYPDKADLYAQKQDELIANTDGLDLLTRQNLQSFVIGAVVGGPTHAGLKGIKAGTTAARGAVEKGKEKQLLKRAQDMSGRLITARAPVSAPVIKGTDVKGTPEDQPTAPKMTPQEFDALSDEDKELALLEMSDAEAAAMLGMPAMRELPSTTLPGGKLVTKEEFDAMPEEEQDTILSGIDQMSRDYFLGIKQEEKMPEMEFDPRSVDDQVAEIIANSESAELAPAPIEGEPFVFKSASVEDLANFLAKKYELDNTKSMAIASDVSKHTITGLPSELHLQSRLRQPVPAGNVRVMGFLDMDGMKLVNDTWGHDFGDDVMILTQQVAHQEASARGVSYFHIKGDEGAFVIDVPADAKSVKDAVDKIAAVRAAAGEHEIKTADNHFLPIGFTVGIATSLKDADATMNAAKNAKKRNGIYIDNKLKKEYNINDVRGPDLSQLYINAGVVARREGENERQVKGPGSVPEGPSIARREPTAPAGPGTPAAAKEPGKSVRPAEELSAAAARAEYVSLKEIEAAGAAKTHPWLVGGVRAFVADPNSTANEGRFRLAHPDTFVPGGMRAKKGQAHFISKPKYGNLSHPGIRFLVGKDEVTGKVKPQTVRWSRSKINDKDALKWIEDNRKALGIAEKAQEAPVPAAPAKAPVAKPAGPRAAQKAFTGHYLAGQAVLDQMLELPQLKGSTAAVTMGLNKSQKMVEQAFKGIGITVYFYTSASNQAAGVDGFASVVKGSENVVFLNVDAFHPLVVTAIHEAVHTLQRTNPEAYRKLMDAAYETIDEKMANAYIEAARGPKQESLKAMRADPKLHDMFVGEFLADVASAPNEQVKSFFDKLAEKVPEELRAFVEALGKIVQQLRDALSKGAKGAEAVDRLAKFVDGSNLIALQKVILDSLGGPREGPAAAGAEEVAMQKKQKEVAGIPYKVHGTGRTIGIIKPTKLTYGSVRKNVKRLVEMARHGFENRFWYEDVSKVILELSGANLAASKKIASVAAITSNRATVDQNAGYAADALNDWLDYLESGKPEGEFRGRYGLFPDLMVPKIIEVLSGRSRPEQEATGPKVSEFYKNLLVEIDRTIEQGVTLDVWMIRAMIPGVSFKVVTITKSQRLFYEGLMKSVSKELGIPMHQAQAAIWTTVQTAYNEISPGVLKKMQKTGEWRYTENKDGTLEPSNESKQLLLDRSMRLVYKKFKQIPAISLTMIPGLKAGLSNFSTRLKQLSTAAVMLETVPGESTGVSKWIFKAPYGTKQEYHRALLAPMYTPEGKNRIYNALWVDTGRIFTGAGAWGGISNPVEGVTAIDTSSEEGWKSNFEQLARAYTLASAAFVRIYKQEGVGWHVPFFRDYDIEHQNGVRFNLGRPLSEMESIELQKIAKELAGDDAWKYAPCADVNGFRYVNWGSAYLDPINKSFHDMVLKIGMEFNKRVGEDVIVHGDYFSAFNGYISNDWSKNVEGKTDNIQYSWAGASNLQSSIGKSGTVSDLTPAPDFLAVAGEVERAVAEERARLDAKYGPVSFSVKEQNESLTPVEPLPKPRLTTKVFNSPQLKGKTDVNVQEILGALNAQGIKPVEKSIIEKVLSTYHPGEKRIDLPQLQMEVASELMPLEAIQTSKWADYGCSNIGLTDKDLEYKTVVYNAPVNHGINGHFSTLYENPMETPHQWEIRSTPKANVFVVVDALRPAGISDPAVLEKYVGTAGSEEMCKKWIADYGKTTPSENVGLFGHVRRADEGNTRYITEIQSDAWQKGVEDKLSEYGEPKERAKQALQEGLRKYIYAWRASGVTVNEYVSKLNMTEIMPKSVIDEGRKLLSFNEKNIADSQRRIDLNLESLKDAIRDEIKVVEGYLEAVEKRYQEVKAKLLEGNTIGSDMKSEEQSVSIFIVAKKITEKARDYLNSLGYPKKQASPEQYLAFKKTWHERLIREEIKAAAEDKIDFLRFAAPRTVAVMEGWVEDGGGMPYEIITAVDTERLTQGDSIDYGGETMTVVHTRRDEVIAGREKSVRFYDYDDMIRGRQESELSEIRYALKHNEKLRLNPEDLRDYSLPGNAQDIIVDAMEVAGKKVDKNGKEIPYTVDELLDLRVPGMTVKEKITETLLQDYNSPYNELADFCSFVYENDEGTGAYGVEGDTESFMQPDAYVEAVDAENDFTAESVPEKYRGIYKRYEKDIVAYLQKLRTDLKKVEEDGFWWYETDIRQADRDDPLIAFNVKEPGENVNNINVPAEFISLPVAPMSRLALRLFKSKQLAGKENVNVQEVLAATKGPGVKEIERKIIQQVLNENFKGETKINVPRFQMQVRARLMPLEPIKTDRYATYGFDRVGFTNASMVAENAKSVVYNAPINHGITGHFPQVYENPILTPHQWEIRTTNEPGVYAAIDMLRPANVPMADLHKYVGQIGSRESVEYWISNSNKSREPESNIGLFGHVRYLDDAGERYVAEVQSDSFQGTPDPEDSDKRIIAEDVLKNTDRIHPNYEQRRHYDDVLTGLSNDAQGGYKGWTDSVTGEYHEKYSVKSFVDSIDPREYSFDKRFYEHAKKRTEEALRSYDIYMNDIRLMIREDLMRTTQLTGKELEYAIIDKAREEKEIGINAIQEIDFKNIPHRIASYWARLEVFRKFSDYLHTLPSPSKDITPTEEQFIAFKKTWHERLIREAIKDAALDGKSDMLFGSPEVIARVEGYVKESAENEMIPYEIISHTEPGIQTQMNLGVPPARLFAGDVIRKNEDAYTRYIVIDENNSYINIAREYDTTVYTKERLMTVWRDMFYDEVMSALRHGETVNFFGSAFISQTKEEDLIDDIGSRLFKVIESLMPKLKDSLAQTEKDMISNGTATEHNSIIRILQYRLMNMPVENVRIGPKHEKMTIQDENNLPSFSGQLREYIFKLADYEFSPRETLETVHSTNSSSYSEDKVFYYGIDGDVETFRQPKSYSKIAREPFKITDVPEQYRGIISRYEDLLKYIKGIRPDLESVKKNGYEWFRTQITKADAEDPVIAFNLKQVPLLYRGESRQDLRGAIVVTPRPKFEPPSGRGESLYGYGNYFTNKDNSGARFATDAFWHAGGQRYPILIDGVAYKYDEEIPPSQQGFGNIVDSYVREYVIDQNRSKQEKLDEADRIMAEEGKTHLRAQALIVAKIAKAVERDAVTYPRGRFLYSANLIHPYGQYDFLEWFNTPTQEQFDKVRSGFNPSQLSRFNILFEQQANLPIDDYSEVKQGVSGGAIYRALTLLMREEKYPGQYMIWEPKTLVDGMREASAYLNDHGINGIHIDNVSSVKDEIYTLVFDPDQLKIYNTVQFNVREERTARGFARAITTQKFNPVTMNLKIKELQDYINKARGKLMVIRNQETAMLRNSTSLAIDKYADYLKQIKQTAAAASAQVRANIEKAKRGLVDNAVRLIRNYAAGARYRGDLSRYVVNVKGPISLRNALDEIDKKVVEGTRRGLVKKITGMLGAIKESIKAGRKLSARATLTPESAADLSNWADRLLGQTPRINIDDITEKVDSGAPLSPDEKRYKDIWDKVQRGDVAVTNDETAFILRSNGPVLDEMSNEGLVNVLEDIKSIYETGRTKRQNELSRQMKHVELQRAAVIKQVAESTRAGQLAKAEKEADPTKQTPIGKGAMLVNIAKKYGWSYVRPELMAEWFTDNYQMFEQKAGAVTRFIFNPLLDAAYVETEALKVHQQVVSEIFKGIDLKNFFDQTIPVTFHALNKNPEVKMLSPNQAMFIYANSKNEDNRRHLYGSGLSDGSIQEATDGLSQEYKDMVDTLIAFYDNTMYTRLNQVYMKVYGIELPKAYSYFPIMRLEIGKQENQMMVDLMQRFGTRPAGIKKGQLKTRVKSAASFKDFDFFKTVFASMKHNEHYIAFENAVNSSRRVIMNPDVARTMKNKSEAAYSGMLRWVSDVTAGHIPNTSTNAIDQFADFVKLNYGTFALGFNPRVMFKQLASLPTTAPFVNSGSLAYYAAIYPFNKKQLSEFAISMSPFMAARKNEIDHFLKEVYESKQMKDLFGQGDVAEKARQFSMTGIQEIDFAVCTILWNAAFNDAIKNGANEKKAASMADMVVRRTQSTGNIVNLPEMFRTSGVVGALNIFQNQVNAQANLLAMVAMGAGSKKTDKEVVLARAMDLAFGFMAAAYIIYLADSGFKWDRFKDDPEGYLITLFNSVFGNFAFLAPVVSYSLEQLRNVARKARGAEPIRVYDYTPATGAMGVDRAAVTGLQSTVQAFTGDTPESRKAAAIRAAESVGQVGGALSGLPIAFSMRVAKGGLKSATEGESPWGMLFPKSALTDVSVMAAMVNRATKPGDWEDAIWLQAYYAQLGRADVEKYDAAIRKVNPKMGAFRATMNARKYLYGTIRENPREPDADDYKFGYDLLREGGMKNRFAARRKDAYKKLTVSERPGWRTSEKIRAINDEEKKYKAAISKLRDVLSRKAQ